MRRVLPLISAAALAAAFTATPATAADLLYPGGSVLSEQAVGKPVWMLQAQCAGFFGAGSSVMSERGDTVGAETTKAQAVAFFKDSVSQLMKDRGLPKTQAVDAVAKVMDAGRAEGFQKISDSGLTSRSDWNSTRSVCLDVADVYKSLR